MNSNFIAPEALNDNIYKCKNCKKDVKNPDDKIGFFQGVCPYCGENPSIINTTPRENRFQYRPIDSSFTYISTRNG
jgi:hypothetical protein